MSISVSIFHRNWLERREHLRLIAVAAKAHATGLTLDVGCGNRPYELLLAPHVKGIIGLDLPPDRDIERRPGTAVQRSQAVDVYGNATQLPFADQTFDTVVSFQVLEHVPEPQRMMGEISRVLRAGGHLLLSTPQMWHVHEAPHDYYRFTRYGLAYLCQASALEVIEVQAIAGFWARAGLKLTYGLDRIGRGLGRISRLLSTITLPLTAAVNLAFKWPDMLSATEDDCVINFLVARKPRP